MSVIDWSWCNLVQNMTNYRQPFLDWVAIVYHVHVYVMYVYYTVSAKKSTFVF